MTEMKASYILSGSSLHYLMTQCGGDRTGIGRSLLKAIGGSEDPETGVRELVDSGLARRRGSELVLEPVIHFILSALLAGSEAWRVEAPPEPALYLIATKGFFILMSQYPHTDSAWRFTPYQTVHEMGEAMEAESRPLMAYHMLNERGVEIRGNAALNRWLEEIGS